MREELKKYFNYKKIILSFMLPCPKMCSVRYERAKKANVAISNIVYNQGM